MYRRLRSVEWSYRQRRDGALVQHACRGRASNSGSCRLRGRSSPSGRRAAALALTTALRCAQPLISSETKTLGTAKCWNVVSVDGRFVYVSNAGSASISGFSIGSAGTLTPLPGTVVALNPTGSSNIDIAVSADGKFLYSLNAGTGAVGMFAIQSNGALTDLGTTGGLPAAAGLNGIAAN